MLLNKDKIQQAKQVQLNDLDPVLQAICFIAMQSEERLDGLQELLKPTNDTWKQGYLDALKNITKFITLSHVKGVNAAWTSYPEMEP